MRRAFRRLSMLALAVCAVLLSGCASVGYYSHLAAGQLALLRAREPIAEIIKDPSRDAELRRRLTYVQAARRWAVQHLALPDNASYTSYADLHRPFTVWNVFATEPLSVKAVEHCFPIAGCVAYRGYYDLARAEAESGHLQVKGLDTFVAGSLAYSTLGHFDDPLVSPLLRYDDARLAALVFHELSHQVVYVPGETAFNESFATFVERRGGAQWLASRGESAPVAEFSDRDEAFKTLLLKCRDDLQKLYASAATDAEKLAGKQRRFQQLHEDYTALKASWNGWTGYDWFWTTPMNNAKLLPFGLYHQFVPAFALLFDQTAQDWPAFFAAVTRLSKLTSAQRAAALTDLLNHASLVSPSP